MSVTRENLVELAQDEVARRTHQQTLLSSFLIGSVVQGNPFIGDTADIDLVLIHDDDLQRPREYIRLSQQVHLDVVHYSAAFFDQPRRLRVDPWLGPAIAEPGFLFDPEHFFEKVQASVRGQFHRHDFVMERALAFLNLANQHSALMQISQRWQKHYLMAIMLGANARLACYNRSAAGRGTLAALRRFFQSIDEEETYYGILQLCGLADCSSWAFDQLSSAFSSRWDQRMKGSKEPAFSRCRKEYVLGGVHGLLAQQDAPAAGWLLLSAWEELQGTAPKRDGSGVKDEHWLGFLENTGLQQHDRKRCKDVLARFLRHIEEQLRTWGKQYGI